MQFWNELEGQTIEGRYPLRRLVRSEGRTAWFETEAEGAHPAILSLTESLTDADELTERLKAAQRLEHPNLAAIVKVGRAQLDQTLFVYAIMEHADQDLSGVLRDRILSKEEARQVAEALAGALAAIHQQGMVHGRVEPASVLAIGETVKLRSDCMQSPGGSRAGDVAGIGAILFEAFTQRKPSSAQSSPDDPQINRLPAPFAEIVRNSLSGRWSLAQVAAALWPPAAPPKQTDEPPPRPVMTGPPSHGAGEPFRATPSPATPSPATPPLEQKQLEWATASQLAAPSNPAEESNLSRRLVLYVALAVALAVLLGWLIVRPRTRRSASLAAPPVVLNQAPGPTASVPVLVIKPPAARESKSSALHPARKPAAAGPAAETPSGGSTQRTVWRVVAYTYHHQDQAQHKADEIDHAHPELTASVFSPGGDGSYLVIVGGAMDRPQAIAMRDKARSLGLPDDTYAQNFSK